mgnify:CR=1 FL=1
MITKINDLLGRVEAFAPTTAAEVEEFRIKILGKKGRIVVINGEIRVMCGETDVFRCMAEDATYYTLLSGDGITVSGK